MKSEILQDEIVFKILDYQKAINDYDNYKFREFNDGLDVDEDFERQHQQSLYEIKTDVKLLLAKLYKNSVLDNYYFFDCPLKVYKSHYNDKLKNFTDINIDADEIDFLKKEIKSLYDASTNRKIVNILNTVNYSDFISDDLSFEITLNKKKEYLTNKIQEKGWDYEQLPDESVMVGYDEYELQSGGLYFEKIKSNASLEKPIVNSKSKKSKQLTSNQIILFLDRLGFFNENKLKNKPKSRQSEIISLLTGLNSKNINVNINKLENQTTEISDNYQKDIDLVDSLYND